MFSIIFVAGTIGASGQTENFSAGRLDIGSDEERFRSLIGRAISFIDVDRRCAFDIIQQAEEVAWLSGDSARIVESLRIKGQILYGLEKSNEAIETFSKARRIAIRRGYQRELMMISNTFGSTYLFRSQFDKALNEYFATYELAQILEDSVFMSFGIHNIGITYYKLKDYKKAIRFFEQAYNIGRSGGQPLLMTTLNLSLAYANLNDFKKAREHLISAVKECGAPCSDKFMMHIKYSTGCIHYGLKEYDEAQREFLLSYDYSKKVRNSRMQLDNIYLLADIFHRRNQFEKAISILSEGERRIDSLAPFNLEMIKIYFRFANIFLDMGDFRKASLYQSKYIHLKDSIYNETLTTSLMETEAQFLERENTEIINAQNENLALKENVIARRGLLNIVSILLVVVTFGFLVSMFRSYRNKKYLNSVLDQRVQDRTRELEINRTDLLRELKERDIMMRQAVISICATRKSIEGLCFTGFKDVSDPVALAYLKKIRDTASILTEQSIKAYSWL